MKKIYILSIASLLGFTKLEAQSGFSSTHQNGKVVKSNVAKKIQTPTGERAVQTFFVDYEYADQTRQDFEFGVSDWWRYIWDMNMRYPTTATSSLRYAIVDFYNGTANNIVDSYGLTDGSGYPLDVDYTGPLTIDSLFLNIGHQNLSGMNDTLLVKIIQLDATGYPTTTVLNTITTITNTTMTGGATWLNGGVLGLAPAYSVPANTKFGVKVEYYGASADTFGLLCGFGNNGSACGETPTLPWFAVKSLYATNSYQLNINYESYGTLPTATGADTYYPCDGIAGYLAGGDSENAIQNWAIWMKVTTNVGMDVANNTELITNLSQNMPNPFNSTTTINYNIGASVPVTFTVTDLSGKVVMSENYGKVMNGPHSITLNANQFESGVYYYTLTAGASTSTRKMVITK